MPQILAITLSTVIPIAIIASLGALLDKSRPLEARTISRIAIYIASPALAFHGMANAAINPVELGHLFLFTVLSTGLISLITWLITLLMGLDRVTASAVVLSTSLINAVNYGIPLNEFAFGKTGGELAIVIGVFGGFYTYTVGVFLASWGRASPLRALTNVLKVPMAYAAALGLAINLSHFPVPELISRVSSVLSGAAVPLMLLILGIQIYRSPLQGRWGIIIGTSFIRLLGGTLIGFLMAYLLGLEGELRQVAIVEASMPTAVTAALLATEFEGDARLVSSIVLVSTFLSLVTLPVIIYLVS